MATVPTMALDRIWLVRHAEKLDGWPAGREIDRYRPLSEAGRERAHRLARRLADSGIAAVYSSPTTRTLATGLPLSRETGVPLRVEERTTDRGALAALIDEWKKVHAADRAILVVGHSNTIPWLFFELGATEECNGPLEVVPDSQYGLLLTGYDDLYEVDLSRSGCEAIRRHVAPE